MLLQAQVQVAKTSDHHAQEVRWSPVRKDVPLPRLASTAFKLRSSSTSRCSAQSSGAQCQAATLDRPELATGQQANAEPAEFQWRSNWFPVAVTNYLDIDKPNSITLLNTELVLWRGQDSAWHAAEDKCPHRLAQMSEGRLDSGILECRYHGWRFAGNGSCIGNPQALPSQEASALKNPRNCLKTYPTQEAQGLLWVWPVAGADGWLEASQHQPAIFPEAVDPEYIGATGEWGFAESPAGWILMTENALDPSHAICLHEGVLGSRKDSAPMRMSLAQPIHPIKGLTIEHDGYSLQQQTDKMRAQRRFIPPHTIRTEYDFEDGSRRVACVYMVPVKPGVTRTFAKFVSKGAGAQRGVSWRSKALGSLVKLVTSSGIGHALSHGLVDQDMLILHHCERKLAAAARSNNRGLSLDWHSYSLATEADTGVAAVWRWLEDHAGGDVAWDHGASSADLPGHLDRQQLLDHYHRHTKHCPTCKKTVRRIEAVQWGLKYGMVAVLVTAAFFGRSTVPARLSAAAVVAIMFAVREQLGGLRQRFFHADRLPDER